MPQSKKSQSNTFVHYKEKRAEEEGLFPREASLCSGTLEAYLSVSIWRFIWDVRRTFLAMMMEKKPCSPFSNLNGTTHPHVYHIAHTYVLGMWLLFLDVVHTVNRLFKKDFIIFHSSLRFRADFRGRYRDVPYTSCPHTCTAFPDLSFPPTRGGHLLQLRNQHWHVFIPQSP